MAKIKNTVIFGSLLLLFAPSIYAKNNWGEWREFENSYFTMFTDTSDKKAMHLLEELEKFRILMQIGLKVKIPNNVPKTIILLFNSSNMFTKYSYSKKLVGYMLTMENVPIIVMSVNSKDFGAETVIKHEYVHVVQAYDPKKFPRWVTEGIAELFSTAEYDKTFGLVGSLNEVRWQYNLREINYNKIVQDDFDSHKRRRGEVAYAQYWLLVNYSLTHDNGKYRNSFADYLKMYLNGGDSLDSFIQAYGKSPDQLADEAMLNYRRKRYNYQQLVYPLDLSEMDMNVIPRQPDEGRVERLMMRLEIRVASIKKKREK